MAKLDDFGRPIYETAEEYNKAHKGGVCPRPYDSPVGENYQQSTGKKKTHQHQSVAQRQANQAGMKKAKTIIIAMVVFFIALNIGIVFSLVGNIFSNSHVEYEQGWEDYEEGTAYEESFGDPSTPLPEGFETFSYNGQVYTLPADYEAFSKMGFDIEKYKETDTFPAGYEEILSLYGEDGFTKGMIRINNKTDGEIPLGKCMVDYFYMQNPNAYDTYEEMPDFTFCDGLNFECEYEDLEAYFGLPFYHYVDYWEDGTRYDSYQWAYYGDEVTHFVSVTFWDGVMESISIEKKVVEEK